ncbi:MAG: nicotinate (nicotinamide) nucleotide adenylyltransferase [Acidobacteria bacterium]|nr:nicotinate (nicotinamide) nucleotide adenylyltransferase [Acidobacteriota bacterium]
MNIALFGGTFDPLHSGHLSAAQAALKSFSLDQVLFVPTSVPPHKRNRPLTPFAHRYAMVALACAGTPQFVPSLLEATAGPGSEPNYSITTVRRVASTLSSRDRLYFLIGADAFLEISQWRESSALLDSCDFIIVSRPGFSIREIEKVIPPELCGQACPENCICLRRTKLYLLTSVEADVSSSTIRRLAAEGQSLRGVVPDTVADYILKLGLFRNEHEIE